MDNSRKGALATAANLDGSRLKLLVIGEGGSLRDANCRLGQTPSHDSHLPNYLGLANDYNMSDALWTDGGVIDNTHPKSAIAVSTIERLNLICVFYQISDGSIVMRRCHMRAGWKWEGEVKSVIAADYETAPTIGTSLVVQPSIVRVGDTSDLKLFYQTREGTLAIQRMKVSGDFGSPAFETRLAIPDGTPFTALCNNEDFVISYVTPATKEVWECTGTLSLAPWQEYDEDESYISVAQCFQLQHSSNVIQIAAFQAEPPIIILMTGSPVARVVWSSSHYRRKYLIEARGHMDTGITLVGHTNLRSSVIYFFVDTEGAVNMGRLASGPSNGMQLGQHYPIPLDSMRLAFVWALSKVTASATQQPIPQVTSTASTKQTIHPLNVPTSPSPRTVRNAAQSSTELAAATSSPTSAPSHIRSFSGRSLESHGSFSSQLASAIEIGTSVVSRQISSNPYQRGHLPRGSFTLSRSRPSSIYANDLVLPIGTPEEAPDVIGDSAALPTPASQPDHAEDTECHTETYQPTESECHFSESEAREEIDPCCQPDDCGDAVPINQPKECDQREESNMFTECDALEGKTDPNECDLPEDCETSKECNQPQECDGPNAEGCGHNDEYQGEECAGEKCDGDKECDQPENCDQPEYSTQECETPEACPAVQECGTSDEHEQSEECDQPPGCDDDKKCNQPGERSEPMECEGSDGSDLVEKSEPPEREDEPKAGELCNECDLLKECDPSKECDAPTERHEPDADDICTEPNPLDACEQPNEFSQSEQDVQPTECEKSPEPKPYQQCKSPNEGEQLEEYGTSTECGQPEISNPHVGGDQREEDKRPKERDQSRECDTSTEPGQPEDRGPHNERDPHQESEEFLHTVTPEVCNLDLEPIKTVQFTQLTLLEVDQRDEMRQATEAHVEVEALHEEPRCVGEPEQATHNPFKNVYISVERSNPQPPTEGPTTPPMQPLEATPVLVDAAPESTPRKTFAEILYERIEVAVKPHANQYLSLQLPARDLQREGFDLKMSDAYSHLEESGIIEEGCYRLADELYDVGKYVTRPNGKSMSAVYEQILDNAVPKYQADLENAKSQQMREWMSETVGGRLPKGKDQIQPGMPIPGPDARSTDIMTTYTPVNLSTSGHPDFPPTLGSPVFEEISEGHTSSEHPVTRIKLAQQLFDVYMQARTIWATERDGMILEVAQATDAAHRGKTARRLADVTLEREAQLASLYSDAVVRGNLHTVRDYLGRLDNKTTSELLLSARENFHESARSSVQSSRITYPTRMLPLDWLESSSTTYTHEEFFYDLGALQSQMVQKATTLNSLGDRLFHLRLPDEEHIKLLEAQTDSHAKSQNESKTNLVSGSSTNALSSARFSINSVSTFDGSSTASLTPTSSSVPDISQSLLMRSNGHANSFSNEMHSLQQTQQNLTNAGRGLALEMARVDFAKTREMQMARSQLQRRVFVCYSEIDALKTRIAAAQVAAARSHEEANRSISDVHLPPTDDSRWTTIRFSAQVPNNAWNEVSGSSGNIALWMGGVDGGSTLLGGANTCSSCEKLVTVDISLRFLRVTIDRSRWFQPGFMDKSGDLMRRPGNPPWSQWPAGVDTPEEAVKSIKDAQFDTKGSLLPAFADSYIIVKDILVKTPTSEQANLAHTLAQHAGNADGVLCFGFSHTFQSTSNLSQLHMQQLSDGVAFRIPGPQILGYIMQLTPVDNSSSLGPPKGTGDALSNTV